MGSKSCSSKEIFGIQKKEDALQLNFLDAILGNNLDHKLWQIYNETSLEFLNTFA